MSEHQQQAALFQWASVHKHKALFERRLFAIPNQGGSGFNGIKRGMQMKSEGLKADTADIFFAHPRSFIGGDFYGGLFIEMKDYGCYLRPGQKKFLEEMREAGYAAFGVRGWDRAAELLLRYIERPQSFAMFNTEDLYYGGSGRL